MIKFPFKTLNMKAQFNSYISNVKERAGWSSLKLPAIIAGVLSFVGDFLNPIFDTLSWSIIIIAPLTIITWILHRRNPESKISARSFLTTLIATLIFFVVFIVNLLTQNIGKNNESNYLPEKSFFASLITPIGNLQEKTMQEILVVSRNVGDIRDSSIRQEESLGRIEINTEESVVTLKLVENHAERGAESIRNVETSMELTVALSLLDRALQVRDGSMQGQVEALQSLLSRGYDYENADFSGVTFKSAQLAGINLSGAKLHWSDFRNTNLQESNFHGGGLRFANFENANLSGAMVSNVHSPLINADGALFIKSNLSQSAFVGGSFRNANFTNANLEGTSLAFADLRGADFTNANLKGAFLIGAILDDAIFEGAIFDQTDMYAANSESFRLNVTQLKGICHHRFRNGLRWSFDLKERFLSDRFSSGYEYYNIYTKSGGFLDSSFSLPVCIPTQDTNPIFDVATPGQVFLSLDREYISKADRLRASQKRADSHLSLLEKSLVESRFLRVNNSN